MGISEQHVAGWGTFLEDGRWGFESLQKKSHTWGSQIVNEFSESKTHYPFLWSSSDLSRAFQKWGWAPRTKQVEGYLVFGSWRYAQRCSAVSHLMDVLWAYPGAEHRSGELKRAEEKASHLSQSSGAGKLAEPRTLLLIQEILTTSTDADTLV